jgi:hypothetical protein
MKKTVSYNIKKGLVILGIGVLALAFIGCEKDNAKPGTNPDNPHNPDNPNPQQKHNVELVYGDKPSTNWQSISMDTIYKYNTDPTVDTIFMVPERSAQFSALSTVSLKGLVSKLRERHNVNPNKVFGKGDLELKGTSIQSNPEIYRFFADTLRYHVIVNNNSK